MYTTICGHAGQCDGYVICTLPSVVIMLVNVVGMLHVHSSVVMLINVMGMLCVHCGDADGNTMCHPCVGHQDFCPSHQCKVTHHEFCVCVSMFAYGRLMVFMLHVHCHLWPC